MKGKKLWLRILAAIFGIGLLAIPLYFTISFTGDPISAALARRDIKAYIQQSTAFRTMGLTLTDPQYNFKDGRYHVRAESSLNQDVHFSLWWDHSGTVGDSYQYEVVENGNVISRFEQEYKMLLMVQLEQAGLGRPNLFITVEREGTDQIWTPGMDFDQDLPVKKDLQLYPDLAEYTLEEAADYLQKVGAALREKGHGFATVGLYDTSDQGGVRRMVSINGLDFDLLAQPDFYEQLVELKEASDARDQMELDAIEKGEDYPDWPEGMPMISVTERELEP